MKENENEVKSGAIPLLTAEGNIVRLLTGSRALVLLVLLTMIPAGTVQAQTTAPLTLDRVVSMYVERNLELQAARYRLERTRADQIAARLRPNPSLSVIGENFRISGPISFGNLYEV